MLVFGVSIFCSCAKKSNLSTQNAFLLPGKWLVASDTSFQYTGNTLTSTYLIVGINIPYYQFNADGTGTSKNNLGPPDDVLQFSYTVSNNIISFKYPDQIIAGHEYYANNVSARILNPTPTTVLLSFDGYANPIIGFGSKDLLYLRK